MNSMAARLNRITEALTLKDKKYIPFVIVHKDGTAHADGKIYPSEEAVKKAFGYEYNPWTFSIYDGEKKQNENKEEAENERFRKEN